MSWSPGPPAYPPPPGTPAGPPPGQPPGQPTGPVASHPHPEPREYPQTLRTWGYAVWRPIVGLVVVLVGVLVVAPLALLPMLAVGTWIEGDGPFLEAFEEAATLQRVTPSGMLYLNLSLASAILFTWLVMRWVHKMRFRWLVSVLPGVRWRFLWACFGLAFVAILVQLVVGMLLPEDTSGVEGSVNEITGTMIALGVVILVSTPLQAMGEEFAFRGYAMQAFGSLVRSPRVGALIAIVLTSVLFALAHGVQNAPLFLDRFVFGLMAGFVVWRTGGLEAGIAMHVVNNLVAFGFALAFTDIDSSLNVTEVSWWQLPITLTQNGVFLVLALLVARRMGIRHRSDPGPASPVLSAGRPSV